MITKILTWSFYILFFFTPLFFTPFNSELFEYNKMMLVYFLTTIIVGTWIIKMIQEKRLIFNRTPLDIAILIFLGSQILSTVISTDPHTSIWGYYSRSNGGLLSIISYILIYYALVSNFTFEQAKKFLKAAVFGGLAVSLYAIPEHFGVSPSCIFMQQTFSADCWVQDVQSRVFATLGQPNWLAAYLAMLIFPAIYFALTAKSRNQTIFYSLISILCYMAFTFAYSRGATIGLWAGLAVFILALFFCHFERSEKSLDLFQKLLKQVERFFTSFRMTVVIITIFFLINLLFGSALTGEFRLFEKGAPPSRPGIAINQSVGTQLENGGTESGQIRLIVWKGALEIFKHYPIFGSGVETFAYSYYQFRPSQHNLVSEWDFLYNKAHNEYLNYLATTGIIGFGSYMLLIISFIVWSIKVIFNLKFEIFNQFLFFKFLNFNSTFKLQISNSQKILIISILASYITYLVQNFFGFSVVIIALFFFVFPAFAFLASGTVHPLNLKVPIPALKRFFQQKKLLMGLTILAVFLLTGKLLMFWWADRLYKDGQDYLDRGNPGRAYNILFDAVGLNPDEPLYRAELGNAAAESAVSLESEDATTSAILKDQAVGQTEKALKISPANTSLWRTAIRTYFDLSIIDPTFEQKTLETFDQTIKLAPTDPKLHYNKALVLETLSLSEEAISSLEKAAVLKPNYLDAIFKLGEVYQIKGDLEQAKQQFEKVLQIIPNEPGALEKLQQIATQSGKKK